MLTNSDPSVSAGERPDGRDALVIDFKNNEIDHYA